MPLRHAVPTIKVDDIGTVLPPTIPGSSAYQAELTDEAMAVVVRFGPPTYFITMTCNSKWPEIVAMTEPGHAPSPIVICRVDAGPVRADAGPVAPPRRG